MTEPFARRIRGLYHPVVTSLLWKVTARALLKAADDRRDVFMLSRYEDLVANTAAHVEKLCSHIVEPFDPAATRTNYNNSSVHTRTDGVHAMSIGRWHDSLSAEDIVIAQYLCAREMKRLGYAREAVSAPPARVLKRLASTPAGLLRALRLRSSIGLADSYMITRLRFLFGGART